MPNIQELMDLVKQRNNQQDILAQPSIMDNAPVDPEGTDRIKQAQQNANAIDTASGVLGSIGSVGKGIRLIPTPLDNEIEAFAQKYKDAPSFFQKYGKQIVNEPININSDAVNDKYLNTFDGTKFKNIAKMLGNK